MTRIVLASASPARLGVLRGAGLACFGPAADAAMIEGSKSFAKQVMAEAGIPTAASFTCRTSAETDAALTAFGPPYVVKDDALAAGACLAAQDTRVERVIICTPDKDLAQCVRGKRVVQLNRRTRVTFDEAGVIQKFGVTPESIPDYLALVGDAADGYPGLPGWGAKSSAAVLAKFGHLESIPPDYREWHVKAANASALADTLSRERDRAVLFRTLATLRTDIALFDDVDQLRWNGPTPAFAALAARLDTAVTEPRAPRAVRS